MKIFSFFLRVSFLFIAITTYSTASFSAVAFIPNSETVHNISRKEMEIKLGRKMNVRERIAFSILKKKQKKAKRNEKKTKGKSTGVFAVIFGVLGFVPILGILFSIASIVLGIKSIKSANKNEKIKGLKILGAIAILLGIIGFIFHLPYIFKLLSP